MTNFAQFSSIDKSQIKAPDHDATILFASGALMVVLLIAIYLASMSSGTTPDAFAFMTVFP